MFHSQKIAFLLILILSAVLGAACKDGTSNAGNESAAKVGSREITLKQVDSVIKQQLDASGGGTTPFSPAELVAARLSVVNNLIQEESLYQKAQKENLVPDDNKVTQEIQKTKLEAGLTDQQYQERLKEAGLTEDDIRDQARRQLAINALRDRENARVTAPTDEEIEKYFNDRKSEFVAQRGVDISIIVTDPANNGAADDAIGEAAAEQKIKAIYEALKGGSDFATVASQRSEDPQSSMRAGNLGFGSEDALRQSFPTRPELPQRFMTMSPGQITEPVKDNLAGRWFIFKVNRKQEQTQNLTLTDQTVRKSIIDTITQQRQQVLWNSVITVAMTEASIKNHLAERIVQNPKTIVDMRPSQLLEQPASGRAQPQPQPRIENQNQNQNQARPPANTNSSAGANANR